MCNQILKKKIVFSLFFATSILVLVLSSVAIKWQVCSSSSTTLSKNMWYFVICGELVLSKHSFTKGTSTSTAVH